MLLCVVVLRLLMPVYMPIKIAIPNQGHAKIKEYYIVRHVSSCSTDGSRWLICGDESGKWVYTSDLSEMTGNSPDRWLSEDVYDGGTFIVYGRMDWEAKSFACEDWDMLGDLTHTDASYRLDFPYYITLFDLKWSDALFSDPDYH